MRPSLTLLNQSVKAAADVAASAVSSAAASSTARDTFHSLPPKLINFFARYPPAPFREYSAQPELTTAPNANPFLNNRHPVTNKVHDAIYSSRRQSDLYKLAYKYGIHELLPTCKHNKKFYEAKYEESPRLKGQVQFKLKKSERVFSAKVIKRAEAAANADDLIAKHKGRKFVQKKEKKQANATKTWF